AQTWGPLARSWEQAHGRPGPPEESPAGPLVVTRAPGEALPPPPVPRPAAPLIPPAPARPPAPPAPRPLRPLVWFHAAFHLAPLPVGGGGRWLRGPAGGAVLGAVGIACLLAAAALAVADGIGWAR